jgi:exonuclease III
MKGSFYEELECVFDQLPKYHMKILLGDFNAQVEREDIFKSALKNESLHEINIVNGMRVINFATSEILIVKITMFSR